MPTLLKFLEMNWSRMVDLELEQERKDRLLAALQADYDSLQQDRTPGQPAGPRLLRVRHDGRDYEWFNVDELEHLRSACDVQRLLRDNLEHYFGIPPEYQVLSDDEGLLRTAADLRRTLRGASPLVVVEDARGLPAQQVAQIVEDSRVATADLETRLARGAAVREELPPHAVPPLEAVPDGRRRPRARAQAPSEPVAAGLRGAGDQAPRYLRVDVAGAPYDWIDLRGRADLAQEPDVDLLLQENLEHYFGVPVDCQAIFDGRGRRLRGAADFARLLASPAPCLQVLDTRSTPDAAYAEAIPAAPDAGDSRCDAVGTPGSAGYLSGASTAASSGFPHGDGVGESDAVFSMLDRNQDGVISQTEWDQAMRDSPGVVRRVKSMVLNGTPRTSEEITLRKDFGGRFGFEIEESEDSRCLLIKAIEPFGVLAKWNRGAAYRGLSVGEVIWAVNDVCDDARAMRNLLLSEETVRLRVERGSNGFSRPGGVARHWPGRS